MTKLSLVAALAVSAAFAGGDITPVEPTIEAPAVVKAESNNATTISGKAQVYYYTRDLDGTSDMFEAANTAAAGAVTLDVAHKLFDNVTANFTAVGYVNFGDNIGENNFEGQSNGAYFNVANLTATFGDTTLIAGRQLIDSPMFGSFDWLLAPSSFQALTLVNSSISDVTLVGTYVTKFRDVNANNTWLDLTDINDGNNFAIGAVYAADALSTSLWYYGIDAADYTQVYADASYDFGSFNVAAQVATTDYASADDSVAYGIKVGTKVAGIDLTAAVSNVSDNVAGFVSRDGMYTSSWNVFAATAAVANDDTLSWKVGASTELAGLNAEISYAAYGDEASELDVILGYDITNSVNLAVVYTLTDYDLVVDENDADAALEIMATYTF